jgi:O-antigen ligase
MIMLFTAFVYFVVLIGATIPFIQKIIVNVFHKTVTYSGRMTIWQNTISHVLDNFWTGHGEVDFYSRVYIEHILSNTSYTYNAVLKILLNYGAIGLALLLLFIITIHGLNETKNRILFSGLVGLFFVGLMNELNIVWIIFFPVFIMNYQKATVVVSE